MFRNLGFFLTVTAVAAMTASGAAAASTATKSTTDATRACGATNNGDGTAYVPGHVHQEYYASIPVAGDPVPILCGNGVTYGAVHIEVKHNVPSWAEAINCLDKVLERGTSIPAGDGKMKKQLVYNAKSVVAVVGLGNGDLITAYPNDGSEETWIECSSFW